MYKTNSKAFRHKVYTLALECYKVRYEAMCPCINDAIFELFHNNQISSTLYTLYNYDDNGYQYYNAFIEFYKFKPKHITNAGGYWFNTKDRQIRIDILTKCIELTKSKI